MKTKPLFSCAESSRIAPFFGMAFESAKGAREKEAHPLATLLETQSIDEDLRKSVRERLVRLSTAESVDLDFSS